MPEASASESETSDTDSTRDRLNADPIPTIAVSPCLFHEHDGQVDDREQKQSSGSSASKSVGFVRRQADPLRPHHATS